MPRSLVRGKSLKRSFWSLTSGARQVSDLPYDGCKD